MTWLILIAFFLKKERSQNNRKSDDIIFNLESFENLSIINMAEEDKENS